MNIIPPMPDLGQMRPLAWALKEVDFVAHSHRLSTLSLCLESLWNRTPSNLKLHHISKNPSSKKIFAERCPPSWPARSCA